MGSAALLTCISVAAFRLEMLHTPSRVPRVIYGPVGRILTAAFLAAAGAAIVRARLLPMPVAWAAFARGIVQLAFVATYFSGTNPAQFFSVNGWHLPVLGSLLGLWVLSASVALLR